MKRTIPAGIDADAFDLRPADATAETGASVLLLHGLTGSPYEVRPVAEQLVARGMRCRGPIVAGHDDTVQRLAATSWQAWLDGVRVEIDIMREESDQVFVVGMSMGGLLALALASEGRADGVAVIGTPLELAPPIRWLVPLLKHVIPLKTKKDGSDIQLALARERHPGFPAMPLAAVHELMKLQGVVAEALPRVAVPILAAHGALDRTAHPRDSRRILDLVGSELREHHVFERSGHIVPVDHDADALCEAIAVFLDKLASEPR